MTARRHLRRTPPGHPDDRRDLDGPAGRDQRRPCRPRSSTPAAAGAPVPRCGSCWILLLGAWAMAMPVLGSAVHAHRLDADRTGHLGVGTAPVGGTATGQAHRRLPVRRPSSTRTRSSRVYVDHRSLLELARFSPARYTRPMASASRPNCRAAVLRPPGSTRAVSDAVVHAGDGSVRPALGAPTTGGRRRAQPEFGSVRPDRGGRRQRRFGQRGHLPQRSNQCPDVAFGQATAANAPRNAAKARYGLTASSSTQSATAKTPPVTETNSERRDPERTATTHRKFGSRCSCSSISRRMRCSSSESGMGCSSSAVDTHCSIF